MSGSARSGSGRQRPSRRQCVGGGGSAHAAGAAPHLLAAYRSQRSERSSRRSRRSAERRRQRACGATAVGGLGRFISLAPGSSSSGCCCFGSFTVTFSRTLIQIYQRALSCFSRGCSAALLVSCKPGSEDWTSEVSQDGRRSYAKLCVCGFARSSRSAGIGLEPLSIFLDDTSKHLTASLSRLDTSAVALLAPMMMID